jgi:hypothetical protein
VIIEMMSRRYDTMCKKMQNVSEDVEARSRRASQELEKKMRQMMEDKDSRY